MCYRDTLVQNVVNIKTLLKPVINITQQFSIIIIRIIIVVWHVEKSSVPSFFALV